jgi:hypothetical protein
MKIEFGYKKPTIEQLVKQIENEPIGFLQGQLYSPINDIFLELNETNYRSTTLNFDSIFKEITEVHDDDDHHVTLTCDTSSKQISKEAFVKYSPLLDPVRYLVGKYDISSNTLKNLPTIDPSYAHPKIQDFDNTSYVDGFFSYLSSKLLHSHDFINALDCYGTLIGRKRRFIVDAFDDFEYLTNSEFFIKNKDVLYELTETGVQMMGEILDHDSRCKKRKLCLGESLENLEVDDFGEIELLGDVFEDTKTSSNPQFVELTEEVVNALKRPEETSENQPSNVLSHAKSQSTTCSSRTSVTDSSSSSTQGSLSDGDDNNSECSDSSSSNTSNSSSSIDSEEEVCNITIYDFPAQAIFLEKCENTLDYLCAHDEDFGNKELIGALMQVIMSLIAFQKCFDFQHNDLHTNNIMYIPTQKQFIYYKINDTHYKVPTYGRIFKIIDFGRATYKYRGHNVCSDSFHKDGDAHTQFNFGRHYNEERPKLEPNFSFDLCRLGTSLIDFLTEELDDIKTSKDPVVQLVAEWCQDDKGRNILWKSNGDERYPGFKLYKMISRTVSKHTPLQQLERPIFQKFKCARKNIKKGTKVMNIDLLPSYTTSD